MFGATLAPAAISYVKIANGANSGISSSNTYTHAIDFEQSVVGSSINGVSFTGYSTAQDGTLNFSRTVANGSENHNNGGGVVTTTGSLANLMQGFYFNNGPNQTGTGLQTVNIQTYTISGLTAGTTYDARIYSHLWTNPGSRPNTLVFDPDGAGGISESTGVIDQDDSTSVG